MFSVLHGITYRFITLTRRKFFGHTRVWIGDQAVEMADQTKVLVDGLDHPELCGGIVKVAKGRWHSGKEINWKKMETYAARMGNRAIFKRLGLGRQSNLTTLRQSLPLTLKNRVLGNHQFDLLLPGFVVSYS